MRSAINKKPEPLSRPQSARPQLVLSVQRGTRAADAPTRREISRYVRAALECDGEITVRIVNETEGRQLNYDYRHKDYATNVLSFAYRHDAIVHGDLVLCAPVVSREALAQGKSATAHYAHLVVHGVLHLQGYDHEHETDAALMEARETHIVTGLGFADPYLETELQNHG